MKKQSILLIISILFIIKSYSQSGWTREKNGIFAKAGIFTLSGNKYYGLEGRLNAGANTFYQTALIFYGEYGITKYVTGIINYPYFKFQHYKDFDIVSGIGDPQLELKFSLLRKIPVVSFSIGAEIPLASQDNKSFAKTETAPGLRDFANLPTGDGDFNYWGTLSISSGFGSTPGWFTIWGQYNRRSKGFNDQRRLGLELGYKWTTKFWTNMRIIGLFQSKKKENAGGASIVNGQGMQFTTSNVGVAYEFVKHWSFTFDWQTYNDFLAKRKNVYSTPLYMIGISAEF
jgi:hypothetical protein